MFNSFAKKKTLYQYKKPSFLGLGGRVPEKQEVRFPRKSVPERKHAFSLLYSDCTDGLFDIGGLFHKEVIKPNIDLHMDMLSGNMKRSGDKEFVKTCCSKFVNRSEKNKHLSTRTARNQLIKIRQRSLSKLAIKTDLRLDMTSKFLL